MVVIADSSPLNYLVLIDQIDLLPRLFTEVFVPDAVIEELTSPATPLAVARWAASDPGWVRRVADQPLRSDPVLDTLGKGERAAISFAETLRPDVLLVIDEAMGRRAATQRQTPVVGILGRTNFRVAADLIESLLARDSKRKTKGQSPKETER